MDTEDSSDSESESWRLIGNFRGTASTRLGQVLGDLFFEMENNGDLYQDLGAFNLGLGLEFGEDTDFDWDNRIFRRVYPSHEDLPAGATVTADAVSGYLDIQGLVSRGRFRHTYLPDIIDNDGISFEIEGGTALSIGRDRKPILVGERPLDAILNERSRDTNEPLLLGTPPPPRDRSLLRLGTEAVAEVAEFITDGFANAADTERAATFWENYSDSLRLFIDLDIPIDTELFDEDDDRLGVGDRIRHVTFLGLNPVRLFIQDAGVRIGYQRAFRYLRETTILKEPDNEVDVRVKNGFFRLHEWTPLKVRPQVRILGIVKLGYTFFEDRHDFGRTHRSDVTYRIDLKDPEGLASFKALLGEGEKVSLKPLAQAAKARDGAEVLTAETRRGRARQDINRFRLFSLHRSGNYRSLIAEDVEANGIPFREVTFARSSHYRKRIGKDKTRNKQYLVTAQGSRHVGQVADDEPTAQRPVAVTILSSRTDEQSEGLAVRRVAGMLRAVVGDHPVLDEMASIDPEEETRLYINSRISLGREHLEWLLSVPEASAWRELARLLLGPERQNDWNTPGARSEWIKWGVRQEIRRTLGDPRLLLPSPEGKELSLRERYRLAERVVRKLDHLQDLIRRGDCLSCLRQAFSRWSPAVMLQAILFRLATEEGLAEPGYHYEIFTDSLTRPVTVTNHVTFEYAPEGVSGQTQTPSRRGGRSEADAARSRVSSSQFAWLNQDRDIEPSAPRLRSGEIYANNDPESDASQPCWKLRLYSDLLFTPELSLRLDLRESRGLEADRPITSGALSLPQLSEVGDVPFMAARFYYDVALPIPLVLEEGRTFTLLARVLNPDGYPVTEEQQVQFEVPEGLYEMAPTRCRPVEPVFAAPPPDPTSAPTGAEPLL